MRSNERSNEKQCNCNEPPMLNQLLSRITMDFVSGHLFKIATGPQALHWAYRPVQGLHRAAVPVTVHQPARPASVPGQGRYRRIPAASLSQRPRAVPHALERSRIAGADDLPAQHDKWTSAAPVPSHCNSTVLAIWRSHWRNFRENDYT
jgi:hypothetical protein